MNSVIRNVEITPLFHDHTVNAFLASTLFLCFVTPKVMIINKERLCNWINLNFIMRNGSMDLRIV